MTRTPARREIRSKARVVERLADLIHSPA